MKVSKETCWRLALRDAYATVAGALQDIEIMQEAYPRSQRKVRYEKAIESLKNRLTFLENETKNALDFEEGEE